MRRFPVVLSAFSVVAASALLGVTAPATAAPLARHAAPRPVSKVRAYSDGRGVTLTWADPAGPRFDRVVVRYRRGTVAPRYEHGRYGGHRVRTGHHATSTTLTHLRHDTAYTAAIWAVGAHGERSAARHTRFTTESATPGRGSYTARYTDAAGHPLAGVAVAVENVFEGGGSTAVSGRDGRVSLTLPVGDYIVYASGANATGGDSDATGYVPSERAVTVRAAHRIDAKSVVLNAGGAVRVRVVDKQGRPMAGVTPLLAAVSPYVETGGEFGFSFGSFADESTNAARTDENGDVTVKGVLPYEAVQACVSPSPDADLEFQGTCTRSTVLPRAGVTATTGTLAVARHRGGAVTGVVRSADHRGFGQSLIAVLHGRHVVAAAEASAGGRFSVPGVPPGTYRVCAIYGSFSVLGRTGYQPGCDPHRVTVATVTTTAHATVVLKVGAAATGTVTGPSGRPVPNAFLEVGSGREEQGEAITSSDGHFTAKGLKPGKVTVCVEDTEDSADKALPYGVLSTCPENPFKHTPSRRYVVQRGRIRTGLDLRLQVGGAAEGTVVDGRGRTVPYALVEFVRSSRTTEDDAIGFVDRHGHYRITGLPSGSYRMCATPIYGRANVHGGGADLGVSFFSSGGDCPHHHKVRVVDGHLSRHVRIVVPTTSAVRVTAHDEQGRPVAGVDATVVAACHHYCDSTPPLFAKASSVRASATTDYHGTVLLDGLKPGHYAVCLYAFYGTTRAGAPATGYADRCSGTTFDVDVRAGHTSTTRLVLHPAGAVSGRITDAAGNPLSGVLVHVAGSAADDLPASDDFFFDGFGDGGPSTRPAYYSTTAADGTYSVRSVRPGDRLVCADPSAATGGSSHGGYLPQCVGGAVGSRTKGQPVTVTAGHASTGVDLALASGGAITGTITTEVKHSDNIGLLFRAGRVVDDVEPGRQGSYRFTDLVPGTYVVCVASFSNAARGRCYQDAAWNPDRKTPPSDATPVQVVAGGSTDGIDVTVPR